MLIINLLIGLGIFLFGMVQLERGIEALSSRWMKRWLAKSTRDPFSSVLTGTTITAFVQSSSMVSLIVLAFASAGIIPLFNAIGVLLGANLGTTFTGWIVATLGFKLDLATAALPAIGLGCLIQVLAEKNAKIRTSGALIFGLGLLLFGLGLMKEAVANLPEQIDLEQLRNLNAFSYLLFGILLTAIIQSSSASMMIALTALHSGVIDLPGAAALVIGADLGTTSTTILGSLKGSLIKRQLALAHLVFNLIVDILAFIFLLPALPLLMQLLHLKDPLYALVAFHSTFNLLGLCVFVPFLRPFSDWIGKRFLADKQGLLLKDVPTAVPEAAISACQQHTKKMLSSAMAINMRNLRLDAPPPLLSPAAKSLLHTDNEASHNFERRYESLKRQEGELLQYTFLLQQEPLDEADALAINNLLHCARDSVYAVKALKDIRSNLVELRHAISPVLESFSTQYQKDLRPFYQQLFELLAVQHDSKYMSEQLSLLDLKNERMHQQVHQEIQNHEGICGIEADQLSTLLNVNREVWHSGQTLLRAFRHWYSL
jgi:phosphate:Na+ symporter